MIHALVAHGGESPLLNIGVISSPGNGRQRQEIRDSWMQHPLLSGEGSVRFVVPQPEPGSAEDALLNEEAARGDIMKVSIPDMKCTYCVQQKALAYFRWFAQHSGAQFAMTVDDTTFPDMQQLEVILRSKTLGDAAMAGQHAECDGFITNGAQDNSFPVRAPGAAYVLSASLARSLFIRKAPILLERGSTPSALQAKETEVSSLGSLLANLNTTHTIRMEYLGASSGACCGESHVTLASSLPPGAMSCLWKQRSGENFTGCCGDLPDSTNAEAQALQLLEDVSAPRGDGPFTEGAPRKLSRIFDAVAHSAVRAAQLLGSLSDTTANERLNKLSQFKVYLYDLPPAFNVDLVECYFSKYGVSVWNDENKERAQNTADIWMHKLLTRYPYRTANISEASMIYIPFYGFLSTHFSGIHDQPGCNGLGHWERVHDLAAYLQQSEYFVRFPMRHAMTISFWAVSYAGYPYWQAEPFAVITGPLYSLMQKANLLVYEQQFGSFRNIQEYSAWPSPLVTIPYVSARQLAESIVRTADKRPIFLYFRGNLKLDSAVKEGSSKGERLRGRLAKAFGNVPGALLVDSTANFSHTGYIEEMQRSVFCIVPRGDTPTSRRLFDAISAGCIPVIVADDITLPFSNFIDWGGFTVTIPESDVNSHGAKVTKAMLSIPPATIKDMQKNLLAARDDFVYGRGTPKYARPGRAAWNALLSLRDKMLAQGALVP